jgi:hypothetical protein
VVLVSCTHSCYYKTLCCKFLANSMNERLKISCLDNFRKVQQSSTVCCSVFLLWAVPHHGMLLHTTSLFCFGHKRINYTASISWVSCALDATLETVPLSLHICVCIHITQSLNTELGDSSYNTKGPFNAFTNNLPHNEPLQLESGRSDIPAFMEDELAGLTGHISIHGMYAHECL